MFRKTVNLRDDGYISYPCECTETQICQGCQIVNLAQFEALDRQLEKELKQLG